MLMALGSNVGKINIVKNKPHQYFPGVIPSLSFKVMFRPLFLELPVPVAKLGLLWCSKAYCMTSAF